MKNAFRIYKRDISKICTNWVAALMVAVLIIIPSLYSLINIKASWDPYSNTKGIKIAVINEDKGTVFKEQNINLGNDLVEKLKDSDKLGWIFIDDKEQAYENLLMEKYYATIEIPENFSENATTLVEKEVIKPQLIYTVNEKKNAIAPKMTDAGINTVKNQLDENITKTITGVIFKVLNEKGVDIEENRPKIRKIIDNIYELEDNIPEIEQMLDNGIQGTEDFTKILNMTNDMMALTSDTLDSTDNFLSKSKESLNKAESDLSDISPKIKEDLVMSENILDTSSVKLKNLDQNILPEAAEKTLSAVSDSAKATKETIDSLKSKLKSLKKFINNVSNIDIELPLNDDSGQTSETLKSLQTQIDILKNIQNNLQDSTDIISDTIDKLDDIDEKLGILIDRTNDESAKLENGEGLDTQTLKDTIEVIDELHTMVSDITDNYDSEIVPAAKNIFLLTNEIIDNGATIIKEAQNTLPDIENILSVSQDSANLTNDELKNLKEKFPEAKDKIHEIADKLRELDEEDKIDELLDMITNNWETQSDFMASPVEIEDNRLFPWPNYGSTATPFYTVLCLWVGGLLGSALLSLEASEFEDGTKVKAYEMYLGKLFLFLSIAACQAIVAGFGALFILKSYAVHPIMYILFSIFVSIVFTTIIFTAASVLDDVGKAIIIIILVLQMAATSGNFPIQVTPAIFQKLYPFLPFTYAINGMRQIMAGIVYSILFKDIAILSLYMVIALIIGITLKGVLNKTTRIFMNKLIESKILRH